MQPHLFIIMIITVSIPSNCGQIHWENLTRVGVFNLKSRDYKITSPGNSQMLVVKMMPNLNSIGNCSVAEVANYRKMVESILSPIAEALVQMRSAIEVKQTTARFFGLVVASAALGVATSAQITAGMAMENTRLNAENIERLKSAIHNTNQAVEEIKLSQGQTILAVQGIQNYINNDLAPQISKLGCQVVGVETGLALLRYYTTLLTVFGPSLRDPVSSHISIQAISHAAGGNLPKLMEVLGYQSADIVDLLESQSINAQIIDVSLSDMYVVLSINYPVIITMDNFQVHELGRITFNQDAAEYYTVTPNFVTTRGFLMSNIDITSCAITKQSVICEKDQTYPMTHVLQSCLRGDISVCSNTKITGASIGRFILVNGNLYANCKSITCRCITTRSLISQDSSKLLTYITRDSCPEVSVDGISIMLGPPKIDPIIYQQNITIGPQIVINPVDVGSELSYALARLNNSQRLLDQSESILNSMTGIDALWRSSHANGALSGIIIIVLVCIGCLFLYKCCIKTRYGQQHNNQLSSVHSMSSNYPKSYIKTIS
uniref:Fusion glycoprotein F0 n=1 Tax=Raton olivaceo morbillivirus TaxID=2928189 RepID=A0A9N6YJW8_9MONO|nr:TPA_asm: fusion protein [Raton olivaceo morbillivirus]